MLPELTEEKMVALFSGNARRIFNLVKPVISEGQSASLTLFDPSLSWRLQEEDMRSKSKNTPFTNIELTGKVIGIINGEKVFLNN